MIRISWLNCWDKLRAELAEKTTWSRPVLLELMNKIERDEIRNAELETKG